MMANQLEESSQQKKAVALFTYLKELAELKSKAVRNLDNYETVVWIDDVPEDSSTDHVYRESPLSAEDTETWVQLKKPPRLEPIPELPSILTSWADIETLENSSGPTPELRTRIAVSRENPYTSSEFDETTPESEFEYLEDHPELVASWNRYLDSEWLPWAEKDRHLRKLHGVYEAVFSIYQSQQRSGEQFEVVLALGLLDWKTPSGHLVRRHLLTSQAGIAFDSVRGTLSVVAGPDLQQLGLEEDMLEAEDRPDTADSRRITEQVANVGDAVWDRALLADALSAWVHAVSARGMYEDVLSHSLHVGQDPLVRLAPAIILRKRTERSLVRTFIEILDQLEDGHPIPPGVQRLLEITDDAPDEFHSDDDDQIMLDDPEVYFPLLANDEQLQILERLRTRQGVLVQGPPGTGKSHTIANLIAHLLATGQRVLVTSHTPQALKVLREKLPEEISSLCVSLVGNDRTAIGEVEQSVIGITQRFDTWDARREKQKIQELHERLHEQRKEVARIKNELRSIREKETFRHDLGYGGYQGTAAALATRIQEESAEFGWIQDEVAQDDSPPLSNMEFQQLVHLLTTLPSEARELSSLFRTPSTELPLPEEFNEFVEKERRTREVGSNGLAYRDHPAYSIAVALSDTKRQELSTLFSAHRATLASLMHEPQSFVSGATRDALAGQHLIWQRRFEETQEIISKIQTGVTRFDRAEVTGLDGRNRATVGADARSLIEHLQAGKGFVLRVFRPKVVKDAEYLTTSIRFNGSLCTDVQTLGNLLDWLQLSSDLEHLRQLWQQYANVSSGSFSFQLAEFTALAKTLHKALSLRETQAQIRQAIAPRLFSTEPVWHDSNDIASVLTVLESVAAESRHKKAIAASTQATSALNGARSQPKRHPAVDVLIDAVDSRNAQLYSSAFENLLAAEAIARYVEQEDELVNSLRSSAPATTDQVLQHFDDPIWAERSKIFIESWNWSKASAWLESFSDPLRAERLARDLERLEGRSRDTLRQLAASKAWEQFFRRMKPSHREHLMAWSLAVRRLGKGTGKYAASHRRAAREHLAECRPAIPGWIMPIYRVAETMKPGVDAFDVVIVDEASQSGPEALFLQYIGKKVVVVGDDKQISPDFVGLDRAQVELLQRRHIMDLPHYDAIGFDNSFFDQASVRFSGRVRLREHFRCMPEIIQFSNNLSYSNDPLIPLRQYGLDRLEPIRTVHVSGGYGSATNHRRGVNLPEVEAIVDQIDQCCSDPAYDGRSMGVISLLGDEQAKEINHRLFERIGPEEIERRHLICGNAYTFQGDERDIIFLSLVVTPDPRPHPLTMARDERRFNVAASRAKDQLWLFHSATLNDMPNQQCVRRKLLEYCLNPKVDSPAIPGVIEQFEELVDPFDSIFEQRVYWQIHNRGYRVIPQMPIAGYRIDLVVEGMKGRMAVECDGDFWHGPDRYEEDSARQRQLERAGWTFWRARGSDYFRDPEKAMEGLWKTLDSLGISPRAGAAQQTDVDSAVPNATLQVDDKPDSTQEEQALSRLADEFAPEIELPVERTDETETVESSVSQLVENPQTVTKSEPVRTPAAASLEMHTQHVTPKTPVDQPPLFTNGGHRKSALTAKIEVPVRSLCDVNSIAEKFLSPYRAWEPRPLEDPEGRNSREITEELLEIIEVEGPILCRRLFNIYARAAEAESDRVI